MDAAPSVQPVAPIWSDGPEHRYPIPAGDGVSIDQANVVDLSRMIKSDEQPDAWAADAVTLS